MSNSMDEYLDLDGRSNLNLTCVELSSHLRLQTDVESEQSQSMKSWNLMALPKKGSRISRVAS